MKVCKTLFISNEFDVSTEYLINKFKSHEIEFLRINSEDINRYDFDFNPKYGAIIHINDVSYDLSKVISVYFRRTPSTFNTTDNSLDKPYLINERRHFFEGMYNSINAKWINPIFQTYAGERKLMQLSLAIKLGFEIPETIVTNKLKEAQNFIANHKRCIIKPISHGLQQRGNDFYSIYTSQIDNEKLSSLNLSTIFDTPIFIQKRIDNNKDIRVTLVGKDIFSVEIEKKDKSEVDWRKPEIDKIYKVHKLPEVLKKKLLEMNSNLGLIYSAIDLILTPSMDYVFLEVNPVGEWGWLEKELGLNISNSIINELICQV